MKKITLLFLLLFAGLTSSLQAQSVTVTSPNGAEIWPACAQRTISWTAVSTSGFYNVDYSTNNGVTWASIATFLNATSLNWTVPNVQSTTCLIRVYDSYTPATVDQSNAVFTINAAVRVTAPNGGESWQVGNPTSQNITWVASGTSAFVTIEYSIDAGSNWITINSSVSATSGSFAWTIPNTPSTQCLVRVRDNNTPCMADISDNLFTIVAPTPAITVTSPNTAVTWYIGYVNTIQWTSQYVTNPFVAIDYSIDGGVTWTSITTSTNNSGSFNWTVPNAPSSLARVRVKDAANPGTFDISNVNFVIAVPVPTITLNTPNGGESWNSCNTYTISWSNTFVTGTYRIEYSTNNGASWTTIINGISSSSYAWQVPNNIATSSQCLIRVSSTTTPSVFDVSNATFTINQVPYIVLTSPNGGENWQVGNPVTRTISWAWSGTSNYFNIEYSIDNGVTWTTITTAQYYGSSPASYVWTLPNTPGNLCFVRVSDYNNTCRQDVNDNPFTILAPTPTIVVTNPNTATTWFIGSSYSINWSSQYVTNPFVAIDYSIDNGVTWTSIVATTNNTGSYAWTVPNTPSTQALIRVKDAANPTTTFDVSNVNFTIAVPVSSITVTAPNGGETWNSCSNYSITWSSSNVTGNFRVEYTVDGGSTWNVIAVTASSSFNWQVPNNIPTSSQALIRVSSVNNLAITDISNAAFTINQVQFIAITSPNGGENWQVGNPTSRSITWAYSGTTQYFNIEYSTNNGVTWTSIITQNYQPSSPANYTWTLPNVPSTQVLVRVSDYSNTCRSDVSDAVFIIQAPTPIITVTNPNAAQTWFIGTQYTINWNSQYVTDPFVAIDYSVDSGATWTNIISAVNINTGSYNWTVPNTPSTQALVRVKSSANPTTIFDVSNVDFTIATPIPTITVITPNGGENWSSCVNYTITWSSIFVTNGVLLEYSSDNGTTWNTIGSSFSSSFNWQVPNTIATSNQCKIRVSSLTAPAVNDVSNTNFTITQIQYVALTSPNGGEVWQVGNPAARNITWAYSGTTPYFNIEYSTNNGATWTTIVTQSYHPSSPATYPWTIPNIPSTQVLVRVSDYSNTCRSATSGTVFTIQAPTPTINVTSPNSAQTWYIGTQYPINWNSQFVTDPFVAIDYSTNNGSTWTTLVSSINTTTGSFNWTVPNTPSTLALVRVKSTTNPTTIFDVSNVNFTIATPIPTITVITPNGGENWSSCVNYTITWSSVFVTNGVLLEYSSDNGTTWNTIGSSFSSSFNWQVPNTIATSNQCEIRVSSLTAPAVNDESNTNFTITQIQYVALTSPNGGEVWQVGSPAARNITWAWSGTTQYFNIEYSTNNGVTWTTIVTQTYQPNSPASYPWTIPNIPSTQVLVRVSDYSNTCRSDVSNTVFTIQAPTPTITVTNPNSAQTWYIGTQYNINWNSQFVTDPFVSIDYSTNNGSTWTTLVSSINTTTGSFNWTVPNTPSTLALVRVKSNTNPTTIFDVSDVNFTIATPVPTITVITPNGGENWSSCVNYTITWSSLFVTNGVLLEYSSDNGTTWNTIGSSFSSSFNWQVPNTIATSNQCEIRVSSLTAPAVIDESNTNFTITQIQYVALTSPNGGEVWQVGSPAARNITWAWSGTTQYFNIEYSTNNGATWTTIVTQSYHPNSPASYPWTIPNIPSTQVLVRVSDYSNTCRSATSGAVFTIQAPTPTITVTSPNTGVLWGVGGLYAINWSSQFVTAPFVAIDYSTDAGATWTNIVAAVNTTSGAYNWTVPNTLSNQCRVRVRDNTNPTVNDISNVNFSIVPAITITSPNGGENWGGCTVTSVTWTAYGTSSSFRIEYSLDNGVNWNVVTSSYTASGPNCTYSWTIPHATSSTALVRVSDASVTTKTDISNNVFTMFPAIVVTSPANNVAVFAAQTVNITWTSSGVSNYYTIEYSINGGSSWTNIVFNTLITTNTYAWTVPASLSTNCLVRVTDFQNTCKQDINDGTFSIATGSANVVVTAPNGGENWTACRTQVIQWTVQGTSGTYNLEYSINGGSSWLPIATSFAAAGNNCSYTWTIPNNISTNCLVRVTDVANATRTDQSNAIFTISPFSISATTTASSICAGTTLSLSATGAAAYTWNPGNQSGNSITVTPNTSTSYTVTGTQNSCSAIATVPITVLPLPTIVASASPASVCQSGSVTLLATGASTYLWTPGGNLNVANIASPVALPSITTTYSVTGTNAAGCSNTGTVTVTVLTAGAVTASSSAATICVGNTATLTGAGATSYTWMPGNLTGTSVTVSPTVNTTYTLTGTNGSCSDTATITVNVSNTSLPITITGTGTICAGNTTTLTASGATTYTWMPGNQTGTSVVVSPATTTTYTVTGTNGSCSSTQTMLVTVNPPPTVVAGSSSVICAGSGTTLTATGATSYNWMPGNLSGASVSVTPASTTTYTVTGTNANGCTATATTTVSVATPPAIVLSGTTAICVGGSTALSATGANTYVWMPGNLSGSSVTVSPSLTTTYTITGTTGTCTDTRTVTVTVNSLPTVTASASQSTACIGSPATLSATGAATFTWQPGNGSGASFSVTPAVATTYTVTGTSASGCTATATTAIAVQATPTVSITGNSVVCIGNSTTLAATGATSYVWQPGNFPGSSITVSPTAATTYTVTGTTGSCSSTQTLAVSVATTPTVTATTATSTICSGASTTLSATGAASYTWMPGNLTGTSVSVTPAATTTYTVTGVNGSCSSTATVLVTVTPSSPLVVTGNTNLCAGSSTTLTASGAATYSWQPGNLSGASVTVSPTSTTVYSVTGTNANGCISTTTVSIAVQAIPTIVAAGPAGICSGSSTVLTATGATSYVWQPGNFPGSSISVAPVAATTYTVTGTTAGCSNTATLLLTVAPTPTVTATAAQATLCAGSSTSLTATGASSYAWMPGNLSGSSVSVTPTTTTTYTVTGTDGSCSTTQTVTVTVNTVVPPAIAGTSAICAGGSTTLTASGAATYAWQPGSLTGASVTVTPAVATTYTVTGTTANGCTATNTFAVTVATSPTVTVAGAASVCAGSPTTLSATGATSYAWQPGNFSGSSVTVAPTATTTYTVSGTTAGCTSTATFVLTVTSAPVVTATATQTAICVGNSTSLSATGAASYTWMPGNLSGSSVTVTPTATTTYTVTGLAGSCSSTQTVTVTVNTITPVTVSGASSVCVGSGTTLTATGAATYLWQPGSLTGASVTVTPTVATTYTVTGTTASGCTATNTFAVTVLPSPTVTVSGAASICAGSPTTLTATGATSYAWQPGNFSGSSVTVAPAATTTYTVSGTSAGCTSTATFVLSVNPLPTVAATAAQPVVCTGSSTALTATGAASYTWMPGNLSGSSVTVTPIATTTYTVTGINGSCSATATVTVTVNSSLPLAASVTQATICSGASTTLNATGASTYLWQPGNLAGSSIPVTPTATTTYTVTGTSGSCTGTQTIAVTVNPTPVVAVIGGGSVCVGSTIQLSASGANGYVWQPGNLNGSSITVAPSSTTSYTVTGTNSNGCSGTASVTVGINPTPVVVLSGADTICSGNSIQLTGSGAVSYTWQPGNLSGGSVLVTPNTTTTYTLTGIDATGCSATATAAVVVTAAPTILASGNTQLCVGGTTALTATGAGNYTWQPGNLTGASITVTPNATTTYTVTGNLPGGCSTTATITVVVAPAPIITATALQNNFCAGGSTTLTASGSGNYIWQPGNITGAAISVTPAASTTYTVISTSGNCSSMATVAVNVLPAPIVSISSSANTICQGTSATLTASGAATYVWQPGNQTTASISASPVSTTTYQVTGTDANGCTATASTVLAVAPFPVVNASAANTVVCAGDAVALNAVGADLYTWQPGNLGGSGVNPIPLATTTYTVTGTNNSGCSDTATVLIIVNPLPNVSFALPIDTVCSGEAPFVLSGGQPAGGTYTGQGVVAGQFDPLSSGAGLHQITYSWTDAATGCTNTATQLLYVDPCAGIADAGTASAFSMYPNPTDDRLTLVYPAFTEPVRVVLYNTLGQELNSFMLTGVQTDLSLRELPVGVYQLSLFTPEGVVTQKVVRQ